MDTSTRADRIAAAQQLRAALRRAPSDDAPDGEGPRGNCGREESEECGMRNPQECEVHALPADNDPELLSYAGPLASRKQQLKAARRYGLRF
jgi:hypothetical protein